MLCINSLNLLNNYKNLEKYYCYDNKLKRNINIVSMFLWLSEIISFIR